MVSANEFLGQDFSPNCAQIVCGDALAVLPHVPNDSVDLIHTSPPYNIEKPYASRVADNAPISEYLEFLSSVITEMKRVVRPGGSIFWQTGYTQGDESGPEIVPIDHLSHDLFRCDPHPFQLWDRIIWRYWGGHAFTKKFTNKHETIMWYVKPGAEPQFLVDDVRERAKSYDKRNNFWGGIRAMYGRLTGLPSAALVRHRTSQCFPKRLRSGSCERDHRLVIWSSIPLQEAALFHVSLGVLAADGLISRSLRLMSKSPRFG